MYSEPSVQSPEFSGFYSMRGLQYIVTLYSILALNSLPTPHAHDLRKRNNSPGLRGKRERERESMCERDYRVY